MALLTPDTLIFPDDTLSPGGWVIFDVGNYSAPVYVRAGRQNVIAVATTDNPATFVLQTSYDGENWYSALDATGAKITLAVTTATPTAIFTPPGLFYFCLLCTVAGSGPATCVISYNGGY